MKKFLSSMLIILLIFNFIFIDFCFAREGDFPANRTGLNSNTAASEDLETNLMEQGTDGSTSTKAESYGSSKVGSIIGTLCRFVDFCAVQVDLIMSELTVTSTSDTSETGGTNQTDFWFTIDRAVFNKIGLFNINYFDYNTDGATYKVGNTCTVTADKNNITVKNAIGTTYHACRLVALMAGLIVLIYIGIRMALSTVASDQAKYKKMLFSWVESIAILFLMPYIMSVIFYFGESMTGIFYDIRCNLIGKRVPGSSGVYGVFEQSMRLALFDSIFFQSGLNLAWLSIAYWCLLYTEVKFVWLYTKRLLMVGFLLIISPLITITYSIDKAGDGKAQAFSIWLKEFLLNTLIQPLHALLYLLFIFSANAIAKESVFVAIGLLFAMGQAERMVKVIFNMKGAVSLRGIDKFGKKEG